MTKIICTGRPGHGGIAQSLEKYYPDTLFISKSLGWDLTKEQDYKRFLDTVEEFDVFINHSQIALGMQEKLLTDVAARWTQGHIISIGSIIEFDEWGWLDPITSQEKNDIKNRSLSLNSEKVKTTHLVTSGFQRFGPESDVKIEPDKIVKVVKFILEADLDIPLIYIDQTNDARLSKWRSLKKQKP